MVYAYLQLILIAIPTVLISVGFYLAEKKTAFGTVKPATRQIIYGVVFGILSVCGTEFGATVSGITLNESTAAPLCAGLIFGAPAGIISGLIGGIERYFATFWGAGYYGRISGTSSIIIAGLSGAAMRRFMFDDKKPAWYYGLAAGIIAEVIDMLLVLLTRSGELREAFVSVEVGAVPLIVMNGLAVGLALFGVSIAGKGIARTKDGEAITQTFQKWLLICVTLAFLATSVFTHWIENGISESQIESLLTLNIGDVCKDIEDASNKNLLDITHKVADEVQKLPEVDMDALNRISEKYDVAEIAITNEDGIITETTRESTKGFDMASTKQSAEFLVLLEGTVSEYAQSYQPTGYNGAVFRKYAGVTMPAGGFLQVGYDKKQFQKDIDAQVIGATKNRHVGEQGYLIICDADWKIVSAPDGQEAGHDLEAAGYRLDPNEIPEYTSFSANIFGAPSRCMYVYTEGYYIIGVIPEREAFFARDVSLYISVFMEVLIFMALFILIYILIKYLIVDNIHKINRSLSEITNGDLDVKVDVRTNEEFASLSDDINSTVVTLKHYIDEAAARIDKELELAKSIQLSALPSVFPPYPNRTEFDIWAGMRTAKEVGGDFYDFYLLGEDRLAFMIADVSGKGIPAAMFMMTAKTQIKSLAETGLPVEEVFTEANRNLCENNRAGMFVTAWMGILDLGTGIVSFANAGHNPPLVRRSDGRYEYFKTRPGLVLAGMDGIRYRRGELELHPGDMIYLYTDGVTEATDASEQLYGEDRLESRINSLETDDPEAICRGVIADVDRFVGEAPQFDDITMVCLRYRGCGEEITVDAETEQVRTVTEFVEGLLEQAGCPMKVMAQINVAVDEIFSNIARYAYGQKKGTATVRVVIAEKVPSVTLTFMDSGHPFNPLERENPDVTLSAEEREIGGLGIFLVKKTMDEVDYEYREGMNRLRIMKKW